MSNVSLDNVQWGPTLLLNFWRSVAAGIVWFIIMLLSQTPLQEAASILLFPIGYFIVVIPLGLLAIFLTHVGVPYVAWLTMGAVLSIIVGDPILFLISLVKPGIFGVQCYSPLNFKLILLVKY